MATEKLGEGRFDLTADASQLKREVTEAKQVVAEHQQATEAAAKAQDEANRLMREAEDAAKREAAAVKAATEAKEKQRLALLRETLARAALARTSGNDPEAMRQLERAQNRLVRTTAEQVVVQRELAAIRRKADQEHIEALRRQDRLNANLTRRYAEQVAGQERTRRGALDVGRAMERVSSAVGRMFAPAAAAGAIAAVVGHFRELNKQARQYREHLEAISREQAASLQSEAVNLRDPAAIQAAMLSLERERQQVIGAINEGVRAQVQDMNLLEQTQRRIATLFYDEDSTPTGLVRTAEREVERLSQIFEQRRQVLVASLAKASRDAAQAQAAAAVEARHQAVQAANQAADDLAISLLPEDQQVRAQADRQITDLRRRARDADNEELRSALERHAELLRRKRDMDLQAIREREAAEDAARADRERKEREAAERQAKAYERAFRDATRSVFDQQNAVNEKLLTTVQAISATLGAIQRTGGR